MRTTLQMLAASVLYLRGAQSQNTQLVGRFRLKETDSQVCESAWAEMRENGNRLQLRLGDFNVYVFGLEANLAKLGYLSENPDWLYNESTKSAIGRFQSDVGLEPTGIADMTTQRALRRRAKVGASGC